MCLSPFHPKGFGCYVRLDVLSQQLARQHDTKLEWIVIWLIVAEVVVEVFWNILIKDILGFFHHNN